MAIYIVKAGDTLSKIARDVVGDIDLTNDIAALNNLASPDLIYPGQQLLLPDSPAVIKTANRNGWVLPAVLLLAAAGYWAYKHNHHKKVAKVFNDHFRRTRKKKK
jgi:LysM repeat protein